MNRILEYYDTSAHISTEPTDSCLSWAPAGNAYPELFDNCYAKAIVHIVGYATSDKAEKDILQNWDDLHGPKQQRITLANSIYRGAMLKNFQLEMKIILKHLNINNSIEQAFNDSFCSIDIMKQDTMIEDVQKRRGKYFKGATELPFVLTQMTQHSLKWQGKVNILNGVDNITKVNYPHNNNSVLCKCIREHFIHGILGSMKQGNCRLIILLGQRHFEVIQKDLQEYGFPYHIRYGKEVIQHPAGSIRDFLDAIQEKQHGIVSIPHPAPGNPMWNNPEDRLKKKVGFFYKNGSLWENSKVLQQLCSWVKNRDANFPDDLLVLEDTAARNALYDLGVARYVTQQLQ